MTQISSFNLLATWYYSPKDWNDYVTIEKANKKEDNIYFGIGILIIATLGLLFFRQTSILMALLFSVPFAILIPFLRMKISYPYLKKTTQEVEVKIFQNHFIINNTKIVIFSENRSLKSLKIIEVKEKKLLEFTIEWSTRKGPTNDEFRVLIPKNKEEEAKEIFDYFNDKSNSSDNTFGDILKSMMK